MYSKNKKPKFSYSRLNTYDSCGWKYKLTYEDGHYIFTESVPPLFGTLIHFIEQSIAESIKNHEPINYNKLKEDFLHIDIPKTSPYDNNEVHGIDYISQHFPEEFYRVNDSGESYKTKSDKYLNTGIYRLEKYLKENPNLEIFGTEQYFQIDYNGNILSGYIDRIFYDKENNSYIIEDIKTKDKPFREEDLKVPLQFVIYTKALANMADISEDRISCAYDLPFCDLKQPILNSSYIKQGIKKLNKIFNGIEKQDFVPNPSPLCAYCPFSETFEKQPEAAKKLCCYYSLWTPNGSHKAWEVAKKWEGIDKNEEILKEFFDSKDFDFDF